MISRALFDDDLSMYTIHWFYQTNRQGNFAPEDCDEFVERIIKDFEIKRGKYPTLLLIPQDHTGKENYGDNITVERKGHPHGHYYLGILPKK